MKQKKGGLLLALQHLLHQVNAPARAVEFVPEQDVSGAGGSAKTAMDAGAQDFVRFVGEQAQLTLAAPIDGAKRIKGIVRGTDGGNVLVETAAGVRALPFGTIGRARLVPRIDWRKGS